MDAYLHNLRELLSLMCRQAWSTSLFWGVAAVSLLALFFGAGTMARVIFGKDTGLVKTFAAKLVVFVCALAVTGVWLTWGDGSLTIALILGGVTALAAFWLSGYVLRIPYWPAFGIGVFALALLIGVAQGAGYGCKVIADSASRIEDRTSVRFEKAK
jgi:hypothetical protein